MASPVADGHAIPTGIKQGVVAEGGFEPPTKGL